ncbi:APG9-domain-containing protein [Tilletiaria anomala UBC 951]|uniref:Autophagy-related protein 9 n=1 Tax=Tilletiaria anomala (strain ATCC 24038 / CBS 436.72 / UBC 951) TaxID=1037660 RepID=A0A066WQY6_TILAU|nr:APG9-domain-containing protein [Tilletiaria anomala UBC 951]KDN53404.1 APG9-domain-containing protein [Tilletiaria anomala UBC 951]
MADAHPSPFGNPSELHASAASVEVVAPPRSPAKLTRLIAVEREPAVIDSPFEEDVASSINNRRTAGASAAAAHTLGSSAVRSTYEDEEEDDGDGEDDVCVGLMQLSRHSDHVSGTLEEGHHHDYPGSVSSHAQPNGRRRKGKDRARDAADSGMFSRALGLGRKVARRIEREREHMGLSQSSLSVALPTSVGASQPLFDADETSAEHQAVGEITAPIHPRSQVAVSSLSPRERALWQWANIEDLDAFLQEAYTYYIGKGAICIALGKALNLVTVAFVLGFSTFLFSCVDYSHIAHDGQLSQVVVPQCFSRFSPFTKLAYLIFGALFTWQVARFAIGLPRLWAMQRFYTHLLDVPDTDVASISWNEVVNRMSTLRASNPISSLEPPEAETFEAAGSSQGQRRAHSMDAHDVANRIMRQENYLIALFNKEVLDINMPVSIPLLFRLGILDEQPVLTKSLQWNLQFCLLDFLFDERGQVRKQFVSDKYRKELIAGLRRRFYFMAVLNGIFAPFIVMYLLVYSFLRYFEEYHKDPSSLGSRQYTEFARWKLREFNELPHLFKRRCYRSYPHAQRYINQFPKERTAILARFVAFIAGSFTAVLLFASLIDPDLFLHFDITPQRNVLFYVGIFGAITAVARGMIPGEHLVFDPESTLREVIDETHYQPSHWQGRLHSAEVHAEFGTLYPLKLSIFFRELLSVILTPFILWRSLPKSAPAIIDFFREFTVHVDGLGYVCSFAVFNFDRHGNAHFGAPTAAADQRMASREGKMEQSFLNFKATHPDWQPQDPSATLYLSRMVDLASQQVGVHSRGRDLSMSPRREPGLPFTPVNSVLAARSQFYDDAFMRSISLAKQPNVSILAASATKAGQRGARQHGQSTQSRPLQAVTESEASLDGDFEDAAVPSITHEGDGLGPPTVSTSDVSQQAGVRGLLDHLYQGGHPGGPW